MAPRGEPERTCVACRIGAAKGDLLRIARVPSDGLQVDPAGRVPGRGAYVHRDPGCVRTALARGLFARALRTGLGPDEAARLGRDIEGELRG